MYMNIVPILEEAEELNYTVGAFNTHNLEMLPDIIEAAYEEGMPIIIQTSVDTAKYIGYKNLVAICKSMSNEYMVNIALHLDHARNFDDIKDAIDAGYSSVMFNGSNLPFKENIMKTKRVVEYAHKRGVSVEGEIGTIGGTEEGISVSVENMEYTNPVDAKKFVELTCVDALAIGIGTNHGQYKSKTQINFELLKKIHELVNVPLVIHGGTGVKEEDITKLIKYGIRKFNVGTELLVAWTGEAKRNFEETKVNKSLRYNIIPCNNTVKEIVKRKIKVFRDSK